MMLKWELACLRCGEKMVFLKNEKIQLGEAGSTFLGGVHSNIVAGALEVDIYVCPGCGKLEFFRPGAHYFAGLPDEGQTEEKDAFGLPKAETPSVVKCSACGAVHSADDLRCPACGTEDEPQIPQTPCSFCGQLHDFDDLKCPFCKHKLL